MLGTSELAPENNVEDLRSRLVQMEHRGTEIVQRLAVIELWRAQKDIADAKDGVVLETLLKSVEKIQGGISKILWAIASAVILAVVAWVVSGGLSNAKREVSNASIFGYPNGPTITTLQSPASLCPEEKPIKVASYCRAYPFRGK